MSDVELSLIESKTMLGSERDGIPLSMLGSQTAFVQSISLDRLDSLHTEVEGIDVRRFNLNFSRVVAVRQSGRSPIVARSDDSAFPTEDRPDLQTTTSASPSDYRGDTH